jgi:hypothetical protein
LQTSGLSAEVFRDGGGSVRDSSILEASRAEEQKGEGRGDPGLFIAGYCLAEGARVARGERRSTVAVRQDRSGHWPEVEGDLPGGPGMSAR